MLRYVTVTSFVNIICKHNRARETIELLTNETPESPDFISHALWPPNSPDLNPVDYKIWGVMQEKVYKTKICDVGQLRQRIIQAWKEFDQAVIDAAIAQWRARLIACVEAEVEHFEYTL